MDSTRRTGRVWVIQALPIPRFLNSPRPRGWIVFMHDPDFGALLAGLRKKSPSVLQVRCQDVLPAAIGDIVLHAIRASKPHLESGALVTVDSLRHRIRLLPI
jgi:predicted nuclease of predicted toxin-antitoxin system